MMRTSKKYSKLALLSLMALLPSAFGKESLIGIALDKNAVSKLVKTATTAYMDSMSTMTLADVTNPTLSLSKIKCSFNGNSVTTSTDLNSTTNQMTININNIQGRCDGTYKLTTKVLFSTSTFIDSWYLQINNLVTSITLQLGTQENTRGNQVPELKYVSRNIYAADKKIVLNGPGGKLAATFAQATLTAQENTGLQNALNSFADDTFPSLIDSLNEEIAQSMGLIQLDPTSDLSLDFNINSGPTIKGTKIIAYLNGDIFYEKFGIPQYNRTMADLVFDTSDNSTDFEIQIAPSVINQFKIGFLNDLNSTTLGGYNFLQVACLSQDSFKPMIMDPQNDLVLSGNTMNQLVFEAQNFGVEMTGSLQNAAGKSLLDYTLQCSTGESEGGSSVVVGFERKQVSNNKYIPQVKVAGLETNLTAANCAVEAVSGLFANTFSQQMQMTDSLLGELGVQDYINTETPTIIESTLNNILAGIMQPINANFQNVTIDYSLAKDIKIGQDTTFSIALDIFPSISSI